MGFVFVIILVGVFLLKYLSVFVLDSCFFNLLNDCCLFGFYIKGFLFFVSWWRGVDIVVRLGMKCVVKLISLRKFFILVVFVGL